MQLLVVVSVLTTLSTHAQNLVPNPGFEIQTGCPDVSDIQFAPPWYAPTAGTSDLFNVDCPEQNHPGRTGIGCAGVFVRHPFPLSPYREYVQAPLTTPLVGGQWYCVSAWVQLRDYRYAANRFGILLTPEPVEASGITDPLPYEPQIQNPPDNFLNDTDWVEISGGLFASGGEQFITLGNFSGPDSTSVELANPDSPARMAYYFIDDVEVSSCEVGIDNHAQSMMRVFPQPAVDQLTIHVPVRQHINDVRLSNLQGNLLRAFSIDPPASETIVMNVADLARGFYHLVLLSEGSISFSMVVALGE